jgi:Reverse transcriptase (RNA-dependent DNA polymerase)/Endonuclease-reverse transcriptase
MASNTSAKPTIVFWNCRGLRRHLITGALQSLLDPSLTPHPPSIIALVETHWSDLATLRTTPSTLPSLPNYSWVHRHHTNRSGGLAILIHDSIACLPMSSLNDQSNPISRSADSPSAALWHTIRFPNTPPFLLGVGYLAPSDVSSNSLPTEAMCKSLQLAVAVGLPMILVGDFNLRHANWLDFNAGGNPQPPQVFANHMTTASLTVLNADLMPGQLTRPSDRFDGVGGSIIDLAITNAPHLVASMDTELSHSLDSDHYPITMTMDLKPQQPPAPGYSRPRKQWSVRRHVERWQRELPLALDAALSYWPPPLLVHPPASIVAAQLAIDSAYSSLEATLLSSFEQIVGTHQTSNKSKAWFAVPGVRSAYDRMKSARRIWKHSRTPNFLKRRAAADAMSEWKVTAAKAKSAAWAAMCSSIQADPKSMLKWTIFKRSRGSDRSSLGSFPNGNGVAPAHLGESLDNLCSHFVASSIPPPLSPSHTDHDLDSRYLLPRLPSSPTFRISALAPHASDSWTFTEEDVKQQCNTQHTSSAPGCDTILPILLCHIGSSAYKALSAVYSFSWQHAVLPQQWTEANVMALWKGKGNRADPASFRPISMTSILIRTFEHLIHKPLSALLEANNILHPLQFGFRKGRSTLDAINFLQSNTRDMYPTSHQMPCPTLFLDLVKAFDRVWPTRLMQYVEQAGITGRAWSWLYAFTTRRRIRTVDANHQSRWQSLDYGVPQGAVLSPLLFNLFINPIARRIATACPRLNLQLYADDMVIQPRAAKLVDGIRHHDGVANRHAVANLFNVQFVLAFRLLNNWCEETRMRFGKDKTQWIVFDKTQGPFASKDFSRYRQYSLCGFSPQVVEEYKYLGVTHHRQLEWQTQSLSAIQRIRRDSHLVTRLIHPSRPPHFPAIRAMCLGYVRARCLYAWAFWEPKPAQTRAMQAAFIRPMQRVLGLHSSSHHLGLLVEAHCPSFEALRTQASARFLLRAEDLLQRDPSHPTARALMQDRARAAAFHCRGHTKSRITVTNFAESTAIPHLIHNVFAHLPTLAPLHPLTTHYFPSQPGASTPPLPTSLTIDHVNSLLMVDTHREWRAPPTLRGVSLSTAPLLSIKTSPALSLYLREECNPMVGIRARIRANRTYTQSRRYRPLRQVQDPSCTFPVCRQSGPADLDTIEHILLFCPRHDVARQQLQNAIALHHPHPPALTLAFLSGEVSESIKLNSAQHKLALTLLQLTAAFLTQVSIDRKTDPALRTLDFIDQEERAPD